MGSRRTRDSVGAAGGKGHRRVRAVGRYRLRRLFRRRDQRPARGGTIWLRASDVRVAQQLATLAGLPLVAFISLISFQLVAPSVPLAIELALGLLVIDVAAARVAAGLFGRERLITGRSRQQINRA